MATLKVPTVASMELRFVTRTTDEYLAQVTIGERRPHNSTVHLAESDPLWPEHYAQLANLVADALGTALVQVEHVGSTSVPGIPAKPIIDVLLVVRDAADESTYVPGLEAAGLRLHLREPDWFEHRLLKCDDPAANIHVFSEGCDEISRMLLFRDRLRTHEGDRNRYVAEKQRLAGKIWKDRQHYADAKSSVVESILQAAS